MGNSFSGRIKYFIVTIIYDVFNWFLMVLEKLLFFQRFNKEPRTVLIFRTGHLGDTLCAVPALHAIKKRFPQARRFFMTNLTNKKLPFPEDVLHDIVEHDEIIAYDPTRINQSVYLTSLLSDLRRREIDLVIYLGQSIASPIRLLRDLFFFKAARARSVCGFSLDTLRLFVLEQRKHRCFEQEANRLMKLIKPLGVSEEISWKIPSISLRESTLGMEADSLKIAIHPSSKYPSKRWPMARFIEVAKYLQEKYKAVVIVVGGSDASPEAALLTSALIHKVVDLTGKTSFLETAEVLRNCRLLLTNDSGPVHIAAAVETPVVGIYSARDFPNAWYPWGNHHEVLRKDVPCQICYLEECPVMTCIKNISTQEVIDACCRILNS